jgi:hypothetical protein
MFYVDKAFFFLFLGCGLPSLVASLKRTEAVTAEELSVGGEKFL